MGVAESWENLKQHVEADFASVKQRVEQDLPVVASFMEKAQANPVVQALEQAAHVSAAPELVQMVVSYIGDLESAITAAKQQGAAESQQPPAEPAPDVPADPVQAPVA